MAQAVLFTNDFLINPFLTTMKRIVFALVSACSFFLFHNASAQVELGFRGGANFGTVSKPSTFDSFTPEFKLAAGPQGALFLNIPLSDYVSFRPEIAYVQKGFMMREGLNLNIGGIPLPLGARINFQTKNIELPLLAQIKLSDGAIQRYIIAGPSIGYAFDSKVRTRAEALFVSKPIYLDVPMGGVMQRWDFSAVGGLGLAAPVGAGKLILEGRYTHGFTRQVNVPVVQLPVRNRGVSVSLGYSFPIGGY